MIRKLVAKNYRSLGDVELEFGVLTALVGINGSGKSNIGDALRFMSECLRFGLDTALTKRQGIAAVGRWSGGHPFDVSLGIEVENARGRGSWDFTLSNETGGTYQVKSESADWTPEPGKLGQGASFERGEWDWISKPPGLNPVAEKTGLTLPLISSDVRFRELAAELRQIALYQIFPNRLREPQKPDPSRPMQEHGDNWASVLKNTPEQTWKPDLLAAMAKIAGDIDDVRVEQLGSFQIVSFRHGATRGRERWFDASQESDGTLRCAGILTALLQTPTLSLIGIEEPELTVHPGAIPILYDFFVEASRHSQVLLTTHSPELLDLLGVDNIRVVERVEGITRVSPIAESQRALVRKQLLTPGELMRAEGLQPATEE